MQSSRGAAWTFRMNDDSLVFPHLDDIPRIILGLVPSIVYKNRVWRLKSWMMTITCSLTAYVYNMMYGMALILCWHLLGVFLPMITSISLHTIKGIMHEGMLIHDLSMNNSRNFKLLWMILDTRDVYSSVVILVLSVFVHCALCIVVLFHWMMYVNKRSFWRNYIWVVIKKDDSSEQEMNQSTTVWLIMLHTTYIIPQGKKMSPR